MGIVSSRSQNPKFQAFVVAEIVGSTFALRTRDKKNFSTALYED